MPNNFRSIWCADRRLLPIQSRKTSAPNSGQNFLLTQKTSWGESLIYTQANYNSTRVKVI